MRGWLLDGLRRLPRLCGNAGGWRLRRASHETWRRLRRASAEGRLHRSCTVGRRLRSWRRLLSLRERTHRAGRRQPASILRKRGRSAEGITAGDPHLAQGDRVAEVAVAGADGDVVAEVATRSGSCWRNRSGSVGRSSRLRSAKRGLRSPWRRTSKRGLRRIASEAALGIHSRRRCTEGRRRHSGRDRRSDGSGRGILLGRRLRAMNDRRRHGDSLRRTVLIGLERCGQRVGLGLVADRNFGRGRRAADNGRCTRSAEVVGWGDLGTATGAIVHQHGLMRWEVRA